MKITICFTYFRSLALANLQAALLSVRKQNFELVDSLVFVDNNTDDLVKDIATVIDSLNFPVPVTFISVKHTDESRTHSWSTNLAVRAATAPWVLFCRADYLLDFDLLSRFAAVVQNKSVDWRGFVTAHVYHLNANIETCEKTSWRAAGPGVLRSLPGAEAGYTSIDAGVWLSRRDTFNEVGGLDEKLTAWGHSQTYFQHKLYKAGVEFECIREPLFFHPQHAAPRDLAVAHAQLRERGVNLKELWARHTGVSPY